MTTHCPPVCSQVLPVKPQGQKKCERVTWLPNLEFRRSWSSGPSSLLSMQTSKKQALIPCKQTLALVQGVGERPTAQWPLKCNCKPLPWLYTGVFYQAHWLTSSTQLSTISLAHNVFLSGPIISKFCIEHGSDTAMLCAKFQNDWANEMDVTDEQVFILRRIKFEFKMDISGISCVATSPGLFVVWYRWLLVDYWYVNLIKLPLDRIVCACSGVSLETKM